MGEFPSKWDVSDGSLETASINGKKYAHSNAPDSRFSPLMENMKSYLPDVFTLEWDEFFCKAGDIPDFPFEFQFLDASGNQTSIYICAIAQAIPIVMATIPLRRVVVSIRMLVAAWIGII